MTVERGQPETCGPSAHPSTPRPTDAELRCLQSLADYRKLRVEDNRAFLEHAGMVLDLGGIAGGYALDRAIKTMQSINVAAALINLGGDLHCFGQPASGQPWTVRLVDPATREPRADAIPLRDEALSTSGSYQNRRHTRGGDSWGHLLRPDLGGPAIPTCGASV